MAAVSMIPLTVMFSANINTSQMIDERRRVQDASDAIAVMHATWTARSLNVLAMNNVSATQLLTVGIGSDALLTTIREQQIVAGLALGHVLSHMGQECQGPAPVVAVCVGWHAAVAFPALRALIQAEAVNQRYNPKHGIEVADKSIKALNAMNRAMITRFPRAMREIANDYASLHGIDAFHFADPCDGYLTENCRTSGSSDGMALPVVEGGMDTRLKFCAQMKKGYVARGSSFLQRGFTPAEGPMDNGGSAQNPQVMEHIEALTEIDRILHDFKSFYDSERANLPSPVPPVFDEWPSSINLIGEQRENGPNSFRRNFQIKLSSFCLNTQVPLIGLNVEFPELYELKDVELTEILVHPDQMPDAYRVLAYAQKREEARLGAVVLGDRVDNSFSFSQATVFNPMGADMFSAHWRMELSPTSRTDDPGIAAAKLRRQAPAVFGELATSLSAASGRAHWSRINVH